MEYTKELEPLETMDSLLKQYWPSVKEAPLPNIMIVNPGEQYEEITQRINLDEGDYLILRTSDTPESIKYRGNIAYIDKIHFMDIEVTTMEGRQRLRDLYKVLRMILLTYKHQFTGWQLIRMLSWAEMVNDAFNIWKGILKIQIENHAVIADSLGGIPPVP